MNHQEGSGMNVHQFFRGADRPIVARPHPLHGLCAIPPHPDLLDRMQETLAGAQDLAGPLFGRLLRINELKSPGLNDGLIFPGTLYPVGTTAAVAERAALERAPFAARADVCSAFSGVDATPLT